MIHSGLFVMAPFAGRIRSAGIARRVHPVRHFIGSRGRLGNMPPHLLDL